MNDFPIAPHISSGLRESISLFQRISCQTALNVIPNVEAKKEMIANPIDQASTLLSPATIQDSPFVAEFNSNAKNISIGMVNQSNIQKAVQNCES